MGKDGAREIREWKENGVLKGHGGDLKEEGPRVDSIMCEYTHICAHTHWYLQGLSKSTLMGELNNAFGTGLKISPRARDNKHIKGHFFFQETFMCKEKRYGRC